FSPPPPPPPQPPGGRRAGPPPPPPRPRRAATHAVLDWVGVTLAGVGDPLVALLVEDALTETGAGRCPVIGTSVCLTSGAAARVNGAASHALDFDDINKRMRGHPTVAILPALFAAGDRQSGSQVIDALITGTEVAGVLGEMLGAAHYEHGFHTTATVGTVAAAAAVCRIMAADAEQTARALSLAATQAAGLRAMFGTMAKPLHAGLAAERGLQAARWAMAGVTAPGDGLESAQGFGPVMSAGFDPLPIRPDRSARFGIEENVFKRHAACYYTHSAIEAAKRLRADGVNPDQIESGRIDMQPGLRTVCDIAAPKTGLEVKFSIRHLVAMALLGRKTSDPASYTDAVAMDSEIIRLRDRLAVTASTTANRMETRVQVDLPAGVQRDLTLDVSTPARDLALQEAELTAKFKTLVTPRFGAERAGEIVTRLLAFDSAAPLASLSSDLTSERWQNDPG
ncbi:MAG: MmgE/PrpD family protein, partial [Pseudomonadota bacterium]